MAGGLTSTSSCIFWGVFVSYIARILKYKMHTWDWPGTPQYVQGFLVSDGFIVTVTTIVELDASNALCSMR